MVYFVGAGPGAVDLITVRGKQLLEQADVVIYAGSLVNRELLGYQKAGGAAYDSSRMTLEEVLQVIKKAEERGETTVRLHTGDPSLYGAVREQMDGLDASQIPYEICPGVSSFCAAAACMQMEYTLPGVSQSVVITRMAGRTPVPEQESIASFAGHRATMVVFLSAGQLAELARELVAGGYEADTPAAICFRATWPDEKQIVCTVGTLTERAESAGIHKTALVIVGDAVGQSGYQRSKLYDPAFTTGYREGAGGEGVS